MLIMYLALTMQIADCRWSRFFLLRNLEASIYLCYTQEGYVYRRSINLYVGLPYSVKWKGVRLKKDSLS